MKTQIDKMESAKTAELEVAGKNSTKHQEYTSLLRERERQIKKYLSAGEKAEVSRFEIGRLLGEIRQRSLYMYLCDSFDEYVQKTFGFKKAYASHLESAWHVRRDLEMELRKKPGLFVLPNSIEATYKLKKAGTLPQRIAFLVRLKAEGHSPTAEAIQSLFPRIEKPESSGKPKSVPDFQRIFSNVRNACALAAADYGERNSVLLDEVEGVLEELNRLREHLMEKVEAKELEEK